MAVYINDMRMALKEHGIRGYTVMSKDNLIETLKKHNISVKENQPSQLYLSNKTPRKVEVTDLVTNHVTIFPSIYSVSRFFGICSNLIYYRKKNNPHKKRYIFNIIENSEFLQNSDESKDFQEKSGDSEFCKDSEESTQKHSLDEDKVYKVFSNHDD